MSRSKDELRRLHDEENRDFSAYLHGLEATDWEHPSLCDGWRVRDVVGHVVYGNELKVWTLPLRLARYGFSSDRSGRAYSIARAEGRSAEQLLREFDERDAWAGTAALFGPALTLLDRLAHHQDIRRALGHDRTIPEDRMAAALDTAPTAGSVIGGKQRAKGLRLEATDIDWAHGTGPVVRGPAEAVFMALLGRRAAASDLDGPGVDVLCTRLR